MEQLHRQVRDVVDHAEVECFDDPRVTQLGDGFGFLKEPRDGILIALQTRFQNFHGDTLADLWVARDVHFAHATGAELLLDDVVADALPDQ